jgi:hypothetical protein
MRGAAPAVPAWNRREARSLVSSRPQIPALHTVPEPLPTSVVRLADLPGLPCGILVAFLGSSSRGGLHGFVLPSTPLTLGLV